MAQYGIMRVEKRKLSACGGLQAEHQRTADGKAKNFDRSTIDWERTAQNEFLVHCDNWSKAIMDRSKKDGFKVRQCKQRIDSKGRDTDKSSVVLIDALYTASPEWFEQKDRAEIDSYFKDCLQYHIDTYCQGDASRVLSAVVHWDETTPHLHVDSIPLMDDGIKIRLSAKDLMGDRAAYRQRQQSFYDDVAKDYGLERGEIAERPEERKKHQTVQDYKIAMNEEKLEQQDAEIAQKAQQLASLKQAAQDTKVQDTAVVQWLKENFPAQFLKMKQMIKYEAWWKDLRNWVRDTFTGERVRTQLQGESEYTSTREFADRYVVISKSAGLPAAEEIGAYATKEHTAEMDREELGRDR